MRQCKDILRGMREDRDLTQSDIAQVLGTRQTYYSRYETGEHEVPTRVLDTLADYYGVSVDYLLGRTDSVLGVDALNHPVTLERTAGRLLSEILALNEKNRQAVVDYVELQTIRESQDK